MVKFVKKSKKQFTLPPPPPSAYFCYMCDKEYAHASGVSRHIKKVHGEEFLMPRGGHNAGQTKKKKEKRTKKKPMGRPVLAPITTGC